LQDEHQIGRFCKAQQGSEMDEMEERDGYEGPGLALMEGQSIGWRR
jgi:hypothetical protein